MSKRKSSKTDGIGCFSLIFGIGLIYGTLSAIGESIGKAFQNGTIYYILVPAAILALILVIGKCIDTALENKNALSAMSARQYVDSMTGEEYERFCAKKLAQLECVKKIQFTPITGDFGADLILYLDDGAKVVVQCKRYSGRVGNGAVQEVVSAIRHYNADGAMIVTNSTLTQNAMTLARENDVEVLENYR